jgi:D-beta-D-heptose 7-phosphate kinase/D-beta-D-heptose 1-phosphate adenosyltransferase
MKILVIGDSCTDVFVYGYCKRLCPEGPIPIFEPSRTITNMGMSGNVVANLKSLGAEKVELVTNKEQITKTRYVEEKANHLIIRIDSNDKVSNSFDVKRVPFNDYDAVIVSDYDKGFLTLDDLKMISDSHSLTFIDTKKPLGPEMSGYTFIKINEVEWENCKGQTYEMWNDKLIVTMSERGAMYNGITYPVNNDIEVRDLSGAGDTFMASLVVSYLKTNSIERSIEYANECATKVVQKRGVVTIN